MKKSYILLLLLFVAISSCRKDRIYTNEEKKDTVPVERVNSSVFGMLVDASGQTQASEDILIGDNRSTTDEDGFFIFKDILMRTEGATIKANVNNYFTSYSVVTPQHNHTSSVLLTLLSKTTIKQFNSQSDFLLSDNNGASITFSKDILTDKDLQAYHGVVTGAVRWIDPNMKEFVEIMPGQFNGKNSQGLNKILKSYGMLVVELQDDRGQMLLLDQNETVELHFPIPQNMLNNAPTNIPLWFFDEYEGTWIEKTNAELINGEYVGHVNKLGYWTCNSVKELSTIKGKIKFENEFVVSNLQLRITNSDNQEIVSTFINDNGLITAKVPSGEILDLQILSSCDNNEVYYQTELGPYDDGKEVVLSEMIILDEMIDNYTLSGVLYDCNNNPIRNGYVKTINQDFPSSSITDLDGKFELSGVSCSQKEVIFKIYNLDDHKKGEIRKLPYRDIMKTGAVKVCDQPEVIEMVIKYSGEKYECNNFFSFSGNDASVLDRTGEILGEFECIMRIPNYFGKSKYNVNDPNVDLHVRILKKFNGVRRTINFDEMDNVKIEIQTDDGLWVNGSIIGLATRRNELTKDVLDKGVMSINFRFPRYIE